MSDGQTHFSSHRIDFSTKQTFEGWLLVAKNQAIQFNEVNKDKIFPSPHDLILKIKIDNLSHDLIELARIRYDTYNTDLAYDIIEYCGCRITMNQAKNW